MAAHKLRFSAMSGVVAGFALAVGGVATASTPDEVAARIRQARSLGEIESVIVAARSGEGRLDPNAEMSPLLALAADESARMECREAALGAVLNCDAEKALLEAFGLAALWAEHLPGDCSGEPEPEGGAHHPCDRPLNTASSMWLFRERPCIPRLE